mmetsp:Transcript_4956/g.16101  ORF Transcript_4956/g.16101 Transcript_4956/m.16101 type:complete len:296 (+) Transcript_4956:38-925(+)
MALSVIRRAKWAAPRLQLGCDGIAASLALSQPLVARASVPPRGTGLAVGAALLALAVNDHVRPADSAKAPSVIDEADTLFEANSFAALASLLRTALASRPDDAALLWRLGRALKKLADAEKAAPAKQALVVEALELADRALAADEACAPCHKWYAILLSDVGAFGGTTEKIKNSFRIAEHFEKAVALAPTDATSRHLLGVWCFEVAKLSWIEKKAAAALFAAPPQATYEQALDHFAAAEQMDPGFYPKNRLMLARTCQKLGRDGEAREWRARCLRSEARTPEDAETLEEAEKLKV